MNKFEESLSRAPLKNEYDALSSQIFSLHDEIIDKMESLDVIEA